MEIFQRMILQMIVIRMGRDQVGTIIFIEYQALYTISLSSLQQLYDLGLARPILVKEIGSKFCPKHKPFSNWLGLE